MGIFYANFLPVMINFQGCHSIQSLAFQESPREVTSDYYSCVIANYFEIAAVLCIGLTHF